MSREQEDEFPNQAKSADKEKPMERLPDDRPDRKAGSQDQGHPANKDPLPGPTPHGDGTVREKDGEEKPSD